MNSLVWVGAVSLLALALVVTGCKNVPEGEMGTELINGDLGVTVDGIELAYLDLQAASGEVQTTENALLLIHMSLTNHGAAAIRYDTGDASTSVLQALTPVLFVDPGEGEEVTQDHNIKVISLGQFRYLDDPVTGPTTIDPGATIQDVLLFEQPPEGTTGLRLSLPPTIFGAQVEVPAWIRIPFSPGEPRVPVVYGPNDPALGDGYQLTINRTEVAYLPNRDQTGFVEQPVLAVWYDLTNTTEAPMAYAPPHRIGSGGTAPALVAGASSFNRVLVPSSQGIAGQLEDTQTIPPGGHLTDVATFERPPAGTEGLVFFFKGHTVGHTGQVRIQIPYSFSDPPLPEALRTPAPAPTPEQPTPEQE